MDFKQNLCAALSNACGMTAEQIGDMLETPPNPAMGDFALPASSLQKLSEKLPRQLPRSLPGISVKLRVFPVLRQPAAI